MIQEQAAAAVIIALISEKSKSREKEKKKEESMWNLGLKKKTEFYETLLAELRLEDENNYNILLRMTSENFEEIIISADKRWHN